MNKQDILDMIKELNDKQTETICIECKSANQGKPEKFFDTISSFSNTLGGTILFGVEEIKEKNITRFEPKGVYDVNDLQKNITNLCNESFEPVIRPAEISVVNIDGKNVVAVQIDPLNAHQKPCYYKPKGLHNGAYVRVGDSDDNMTEYEIYKCMSYRENEQDDKRAIVDATMEDFDKELLKKFIKKAKKDKAKFSEFSDEDVLLTMGVLTKVDDKIFPTVAGIMVLGLYPQKFFPQWFIAAMVFPGFEVAELGEEGQRFNNNKRIDGNIVDMYNETINFIERNMKVKMKLNDKTGLREDIPEYPVKSLREAVSNILIHRDMSRYKESVYSSISMFKNRIEFRNVGNLYGDNTIDSIISERDVEVRNKTTIGILEVLNEVIENRHTGIRTMINEMKKSNLPKPIFKNERDDFTVTFYNGEYPELYPEELQKNEKNGTVNVTLNDTVNVTVKLNKTEKKIIEVIANNPNITQKELANNLDLSERTIKRNTNTLQEKGILKRVGADKNGYWKIKL